MNPHIIDVVTRIVFFASVGHSCLPPWEFLNDFPRTQKVYKVLVYIIGFIAINGRSTVYHSISVAEPEGVNESVAHEEARIAAPKEGA
jgi:hypothetical protein